MNAETEQILTQETLPLAALLQQEANMRGRETLTSLAWAAVFTSALMAMTNRLFTDYSITNLKICLGLMAVMSGGVMLQLARRSYRRKRSLAHALSQKQSLSQVGPLIRTLRMDNTPVRNLAKQELIRLLPEMQASDAGLLGNSERAILLRLLPISPKDFGYRDLTELFSRSAYRREVNLRVSILKAMQQVGGIKELPTVERLARGFPNLGFHTPALIQEAAKECLPFLEARVTEQRASEQLLRPSSAQALPNNLLLRPADMQPDTAPEQLLRASQSGS